MFDLVKLTHLQKYEPKPYTRVSLKQRGGLNYIRKRTSLGHNHSYTRLYANQGTFLSICSHPNIVKYIHSYFCPDYTFYVEMQYLRGGPLSKVRIDGDYQKVYKWMYQITNALAYIHKLGIIHRDIKPANLVLDQHANVKIIDFGVSAFKWCIGLQQNSVIGTPCYFAPQIINDVIYNQKTDIFALGITMYQVVYQSFPFKGQSKHEFWRSILHDEVEFKDTCPKDLIRIIQKMLAKSPEDRYSTEQILHELYLREESLVKIQYERV